MPMKEIVLREGKHFKETTQVNMCDICAVGKSEHYCSICKRWICEKHSIKLNLDFEDYIPYVCTECYNIKRHDKTYADILIDIPKQIENLYESGDIILREWRKEKKLD